MADADEREQFELTTFTPYSLRKLFEHAGFEVIQLVGKTIIPVRQNKILLERPDAIERLIRMETELAKDPSTAACAGHLQCAAENPGTLRHRKAESAEVHLIRASRPAYRMLRSPVSPLRFNLESWRRIPRARRAGLSPDLRAEALQVGDPHHRQAKAVGTLDDGVHVMLRGGNVVAFDVDALIGDRLNGLALARAAPLSPRCGGRRRFLFRFPLFGRLCGRARSFRLRSESNKAPETYLPGS